MTLKCKTGSGGGNLTSPQAQIRGQLQAQEQQRQVSGSGVLRGQQRDVDTCLRCQRQGHWARDCPNKTKTSFSSPSNTNKLEPIPTASPSPPPPNLAMDGSQRQVSGSGILLGQQRNVDTCFRCQRQGHWARDCPSKTKTSSSPNNKSNKLEPIPTPSPSPPPPLLAMDSSQYLPRLLCPCGAGICPLRTSRTDKNPDRLFYCCPTNSPATRCPFFKWYDSVTSDEFIYVPMCSCGAGYCRVLTQTIGPNAGRNFFVCHIKKGQGACNFFRWQDAPEMTDCDDASPVRRDLVEEGTLTELDVENESPMVDAPQNPQNLEVLLKRDNAMLVDFKEEEGPSNRPLLRNYKRLQYGASKIHDASLNSATEQLEMSQVKSNDSLMETELEPYAWTSEVEIHHRQKEFWKQISSAGTSLAAFSVYSHTCSSALPATLVSSKQSCLVATSCDLNLGLQSLGWWGRIAFPPSKCLIIPSPKPFFCCVFPSLEPIFVQNVKAFDIEVSDIERNNVSLVTTSQDAQPLSVVLWEPSSIKCSPEIVQSNVMRGLISEAFGEVAVNLQKKLVNLLQSMDSHQHESMVQEATTTFTALDQLSVDYQTFSKQVNEYISHASLLAEIELSICNDYSSQELVNLYNSQKKRLDDISDVHARAKATLDTSRERLQSIQEEASRVRSLLFEIESELLFCETQNKDLESRFFQISQDMAESKRSFEVASKEAEEGSKLRQLKESERDAAKAAFEKARILLRQ